MAASTQLKQLINRLLARCNVRIESRTAERAEAERLCGLLLAGHFEQMIAPVLPQFQNCNPALLLAAVKQYEAELERLTAEAVPDQFSFQNDYYRSPDAEILYALTRLHQPRRIIEVGSGNSTLLFRQAIRDGALNTKLISIDPYPRREIAAHSDEVVRRRVEDLNDPALFARLAANDFLFIDSSHELKPGNDVLFLFLRVLPALAPGVIVHIHDVFLPYEYPKAWIEDHRWSWTEQYLVQALLEGSTQFKVLWPGYYLQRSRPDFAGHFKFWNGADARSLWLQRM